MRAVPSNRQFSSSHSRVSIARRCHGAEIGVAVRAVVLGLVIAALPPSATALHAQAVPRTRTYANPAATIEVPESLLRIDLNGTDALEFFRVAGVLPRSDGSFIVASGGTNEFRYFDAAGKFVSRAGRKGAGPGEYQSFALTSIVSIRGDSLAIYDGIARRISILSRTGAFVRSVSVAQSPTGLGSVTGLVAGPSGVLLVGFSEVIAMKPQPEAIPFYSQYFTVSTVDGALKPFNMRAFHSDHFVQATTPERGGVAYWDLAFGRKGSMAATRTGVFVGDGTDWSIQEYSPSGVLVGTHRVTRAVAALTPADRDEYRTNAIKNAKGADSISTERRVREMPYPKNKPAYNRIESETGGDRVWVQPYPSGKDAQNDWLRLNPQASVAEAFRLPARFRALAFSPSRVYGVWRDSDDVEHVRVYELPAVRK